MQRAQTHRFEQQPDSPLRPAPAALHAIGLRFKPGGQFHIVGSVGAVPGLHRLRVGLIGLGAAARREQHRRVRTERQRQQLRLDRPTRSTNAHDLGGQWQRLVQGRSLELRQAQQLQRVGTAGVVERERLRALGQLLGRRKRCPSGVAQLLHEGLPLLEVLRGVAHDHRSCHGCQLGSATGMPHPAGQPHGQQRPQPLFEGTCRHARTPVGRCQAHSHRAARITGKHQWTAW
jgi:hypothetical protein